MTEEVDTPFSVAATRESLPSALLDCKSPRHVTMVRLGSVRVLQPRRPAEVGSCFGGSSALAFWVPTNRKGVAAIAAPSDAMALRRLANDSALATEGDDGLEFLVVLERDKEFTETFSNSEKATATRNMRIVQGFENIIGMAGFSELFSTGYNFVLTKSSTLVMMEYDMMCLGWIEKSK